MILKCLQFAVWGMAAIACIYYAIVLYSAWRFFRRSAPLLPGTKAVVDGELVVLEGTDVEQVGQSAANIERATHIRDYDPRVFQDGIYLVRSAHVKESS